MKKEDTYKSTCCYCGVGCGIVIKKDNSNKISIEGDISNPVNKGMLCSKGMNLHYTVMDQSDRLLYPEMRLSRSHPMKKVTWDTALERTAAVFKSLINKYGPDSVGFYVSGQCLTEEYYVINKLMKGFIGSNNIDTNSRLCMSSAVTGYKMALGEDSVPVSYEDIELADCFFITGANPAWCHPILYRRIEEHKINNPDVKIIVADPRRTQSCSLADIHLQITPGTDVVLNHAIARCLIENGYIDDDFIINHTEGFEDYKNSVMKRSINEAADICGVPAYDITTAAHFIGESKGFISLWAMGLNQSVIGVNKNLSLINLSLITGKIGKPGNGPFSLTGQPNAMGGREVGGLANLLSNHRNLDDSADREYVEEFWGSKKIQAKPGLTATEMFEALESGRLKAIWIVCTNPLVSLPDVRKAERALANAKFVVVQDISQNSDTLKYADVVLPAASWLEKEGTMTNSERRISFLQKVIEPPGEALPDAEIIIRFAHKMGFINSFNYKDSSEIFDEHCRLSKGTNADISALSYSVLKEKGAVQWPYTESNPGTKRLFTDFSFYTTGRKARIHSVPDNNGSENITPDYPLILTTGRVRDQWHTMTKTGKVNKLLQHTGRSFLEINPLDAAERNIKNNDLVEVSAGRGNVRVNAKVTDDIKRGVVFLPMHWGKVFLSDLWRANNLTNNLVDPKSKEPDFKFSAVQVEKYNKPVEKIIIIGAGAGAYGFIKAYRELNNTDEIVVFSKESHTFYNRILLPDYINGSKTWENLQKLVESDSNIILHKGISIYGIDREAKTVYDSEGNDHTYDKLIICTGSRPNTLKNIPLYLEGVITIRTKEDADKLLPYVNEQSHIVVVGGGLLGLEMAGALIEKDVKVTLVHRTSRLMDKQLDITGSSLLHEMLSEMGINILYNEEVEMIYGRKHINGVKFKNGKYIECDAMVVAIGTTPNIELAKDAGLEYSRGVIVNNRMQTSDPNIFAVGEVAEYNGSLYGITASAEEQAEILAGYLSGDENIYYSGSVMMNILKINGISLCSLGLSQIPENKNGYEEIVFLDKAKKYYKKCIVHNDRLAGALLIGDSAEFIEFKNLIRDKIELSEKRLQLLRSSAVVEPAEGEIICSCNSVGRINLTNKIKNGCFELKELFSHTGAGMGCGSCRPEVKKILDNELKNIQSGELTDIAV
ncbi:MAG: molybdopterin-dependent oxidoreductase [Ignavibacteriaceae bacterium]